MDSIWVILSLSSWYYCVNLSHNVIIIMILLLLFGARCYYHHDIVGVQWGNLMIPLYDISVSWGVFSPPGTYYYYYYYYYYFPTIATMTIIYITKTTAITTIFAISTTVNTVISISGSIA